MGRSLNLWLGLLVLVCAVSLWLANGGGLPQLNRTDGTHGPRGPEDAEAHIRLPVHLLVLNGTEVPGLAREISLQVTRFGCVVEGVGNAENTDTPVSLLINRRLSTPEARDLAARLGGVPVVRQWDERVTEDAVLVLGRDWTRVRDSFRPGN